jgi:hypothetical protein
MEIPFTCNDRNGNLCSCYNFVCPLPRGISLRVLTRAREVCFSVVAGAIPLYSNGTDTTNNPSLADGSDCVVCGRRDRSANRAAPYLFLMGRVAFPFQSDCRKTRAEQQERRRFRRLRHGKDFRRSVVPVGQIEDIVEKGGVGCRARVELRPQQVRKVDQAVQTAALFARKEIEITGARYTIDDKIRDLDEKDARRIYCRGGTLGHGPGG